MTVLHLQKSELPAAALYMNYHLSVSKDQILYMNFKVTPSTDNNVSLDS